MPGLDGALPFPVCRMMTSQSVIRQDMMCSRSRATSHTDQGLDEVHHAPRKQGLCRFSPGIPVMLMSEQGCTAVRFSLQLGQQSDGWSSSWMGYAHTLTSLCSYALNHTLLSNPRAVIWVEKCASCGAPQSHSPGPRSHKTKALVT